MITPKFHLSQDDTTLTVVIHAPYIKAQQVDLHVEGDEFRFHVSPYFLRLTLPGRVVEDESSTARYDISSGDLTVTLNKETPGEHFPDLDLLSKLLARKSERDPSSFATTPKPLVEIISSTSTDLPPSENFDELEEIDWDLPQEINTEPLNSLLKVKYGFNQQYSGYFDHVQETPNEINEIPSPETTSIEDRRRIRIELENEKFDEDYFVGDCIGASEPEFKEILKFKTSWSKALRDVQRGLFKSSNTKSKISEENPEPVLISKPSLISNTSSTSDSAGFFLKEVSTRIIKPEEDKPEIIEIKESSSQTTSDNTLVSKMEELSVSVTPKDSQPSPVSLHPYLEFTEKERSMLLNLPRREYLIDSSESRVLYLGLLDLVLSYSYDHRITEGEPSTESSWTIGKLCSTMACLERFSSIKEVLIANRRRILSYPLYRHFELGEAVVRDTLVIFKLGKRALLKVLLSLKALFDYHDVHYRYAKIFLDDYCLWIQTHAKDEIIRSLSSQLHNTKLTLEDFAEWDLEALEEVARSVNLETLE